MSEQPDGFLQMGASYHFKRDKLENYRNKTIESQGFHQWTQGNMYKSSYAHFHSNESTNPKNTVIPGYAGYIPTIKAENVHARGFSAMAKQSFQNDKLGKNPFGLSSTGFNLDKGALIDRSKVASSSKYGKTEIQRAHPGWNADWKSTTHDSFKPPKTLLDPTYRSTDKSLQTGPKGSGYATNHSYLDGKGWKPDPILRGDNHRSQYRDRFNADHPFHREVNVSKVPQLSKTEMNYKRPILREYHCGSAEQSHCRAVVKQLQSELLMISSISCNFSNDCNLRNLRSSRSLTSLAAKCSYVSCFCHIPRSSPSFISLRFPEEEDLRCDLLLDFDFDKCCSSFLL